ncbi:hypothetical protein EVAR_37176_1 [Eumeta japonica]|uniref:Uncharacterized protein n=1 Tax=Eumeta variegata TaxID=151549 RepID=A0A4C1WHZ5_EUMVA|nr:hypothetical protein EVAR_37176_1 [Eumeta japonica]
MNLTGTATPRRRPQGNKATQQKLLFNGYYLRSTITAADCAGGEPRPAPQPASPEAAAFHYLLIIFTTY